MFKDKKTQADGNICLTAEKNNTEMILRAIEAMRTRVKTEAPLIHCITNPISIHDCANVVLAAAAACVILGISGEIGAENCQGTGSFQVMFQDALFSVDEKDIRGRIRLREI